MCNAVMCKQEVEIAAKMDNTAQELITALRYLDDKDAETFRAACVVFAMATAEDARKLRRWRPRRLTSTLERYIRESRDIGIMYIVTVIYVATFEHFEGPVNFDFPCRATYQRATSFWSQFRDILGLAPHLERVDHYSPAWFANVNSVLGHQPSAGYIQLHSKIMWCRRRLPQHSTPQTQQWLRTVLILPSEPGEDEWLVD